MSTESPPGPDSEMPQGLRKRWPLYVVIAALVIAGVLILGYWLIFGQNTVSTNDAYVDGNIIEVFPRVDGSVIMISVNDTDYVKEGQLLASLDPHRLPAAAG